MSVNKHRDHVVILPEDDANRQLANGFLLEVNSNQIRVLTEVRGWQSVIHTFHREHIKELRKYRYRRLILLLDFDDDAQRSRKIIDDIPDDLRDQVFLLGVQSEPEALKQAGFGSYETIGRALATECRDGAHDLWRHDLLRQNASELTRLRAAIHFLF
jgi:hypothetical protein